MEGKGLNATLDTEFVRNIMYRPFPVDGGMTRVSARPIMGIPYTRNQNYVPVDSKFILSRDMALNRGTQNTPKLGESISSLKDQVYDDEQNGGADNEPEDAHVNEVVNILLNDEMKGGSKSLFNKIGDNLNKAAKTVAKGIKKAAVSAGKTIKKEHLISKGLKLASGLVEKFGGPALETVGTIIGSEGGPIGALIGDKIGKEGAKIAGKATLAASKFAEKKGFGCGCQNGQGIENKMVGPSIAYPQGNIWGVTGRPYNYQMSMYDKPIEPAPNARGVLGNTSQSFNVMHPLNFKVGQLANLM